MRWTVKEYGLHEEGCYRRVATLLASGGEAQTIINQVGPARYNLQGSVTYQGRSGPRVSVIDSLSLEKALGMAGLLETTIKESLK